MLQPQRPSRTAKVDFGAVTQRGVVQTHARCCRSCWRDAASSRRARSRGQRRARRPRSAHDVRCRLGSSTGPRRARRSPTRAGDRFLRPTARRMPRPRTPRTVPSTREAARQAHTRNLSRCRPNGQSGGQLWRAHSLYATLIRWASGFHVIGGCAEANASSGAIATPS